jgi:hypothetical protein
MLQPLLACGDYDCFKSIMTQKNIDLELQALALLQKQIGQPIGAYDDQGKGSPTPQEKLAQQEFEEEEALQDALKLSKRESEMKLMAEDEAMEELLALAIQESLKASLIVQKEQPETYEASSQEGESERLNKQAQSPGVKETSCEKQIVSTKTVIPDSTGGAPVLQDISRRAPIQQEVSREAPMQQEISGEQAAQLWIQSAKSELQDRQSPIVQQSKSVSSVKMVQYLYILSNFSYSERAS